uniref:Phospholipase A2-like domain-containing protein n=1 Tax=Parvoviridae sp. TaxID=1940570 RepID=A0A893A8M9_9VIRU|nr:MAG: hypothetical protein 3 [Parvoviridae sp.]
MSATVFSNIRDGLRLRRPIGYQELLQASQSGKRVSFLRVGDNLYLAGEEAQISEFVDPSEIESFEDVIYENQGYSADQVEQIELDDIELDTTAENEPLLQETSFSSTPGLAEAGGIAGTGAVSAAPSTPIIVTGVAVAAGTIAVGTTVGVLQTKRKSDVHKDPVVSLPDHRYIGPGNTVDETPPIDTDDAIAREHDIAYNKAETQEDVQEADRQGANEFLTDVIHNNNVHSIAGYIGLKAKEKIESVIGVQYPNNLPLSTGMYSHHRSERAVPKFPVNADPRQSPYWRRANQFSSRAAYLNWAKYTWSQWNNARQNRGQRRVLPPARLGIAVTQRPRTGNINDAMTFDEFRNSEGYDAREFSDYNDDDLVEVEELGTINMDQLADVMRGNAVSSTPNPNLDGGISPSLADRPPLAAASQPAGPSGQSSGMASRDEAGPSKRQRVDESSEIGDSSGESLGFSSIPSSIGRSPGRMSSMAAESSGADGGFDSTTGPSTTLFKGGYQSTSGTMTFTKCHEITMEAIPYTTIASDYNGGSMLTVTPLAKIPWEYPYFYLSKEDYEKIPPGSYFNSCSVDIMGITYPTGYPTGGTTASVSSTNHAKILMAALDLEKKNRGGLDVEVKTISAEMVPNSIDVDTTASTEDFIEKQYGTDQTALDADYVTAGVATDIPYRQRVFWAMYQPNRAQAKARNFFSEEGDPLVIVNNLAPGQEYFRNYISQVNANNFVWDQDVLKALIGAPSLQYKFVSAPIGEQFKHMEIFTNNVTDQAVGSGENYNMLRSITNCQPGGNLTVTERIVPSSRNSLPYVSYTNRIEQGATFVKGDNAKSPARQPSFHIGMKAIEKFDPTVAGSRASTFVQARMTIHVKATIKVTNPQYPDRFIRSKEYNTGIESAVAGIGRYQNGPTTNVVTYGLNDTSLGAPTRDEVDDPNDPIRVLPSAVRRPRRSTRTAVTEAAGTGGASTTRRSAPGRARADGIIN